MSIEASIRKPLAFLSLPSFNFNLVEKIGGEQTSILLIFSPKYNKHFILKLFPYETDEISTAYENEIRFSNLSHPHIIPFLRVQDKQKSELKGKTFFSSYIVMEYCPNGDFANLIGTTNLFQDEKLVRTYFHQLIEGIEYLHSQGVAHLDLKLDNLVLAEDYTLKIIDFDKSFKKEDDHIYSRGTRNYRAPEVRSENCLDPEAADIFSAGIILFVLLCGFFPYVEDTFLEGFDSFSLMANECSQFWELHKKYSRFNPTQEFKDLFFSMVKIDTIERATLEEVKKNKWYCGPVYTKKELNQKVARVLSKAK